MRRRFTLLLALFSCAASLFGQGLTTTATKDDWEEINFEFDYSVLTDGYPSLLRLAELLQTNPDYRVRVEGHTDQLGSNAYNDKLAQRRADTVRDFLVKYGARAGQIEAVGRGKAQPKVNSMDPPARFMNRRVVLTVYDGQGRVVSAGGVGDAIRAMEEIAKKQEQCCEQILKRLDKLDEIVAMLRDLKGENDKLKDELANLRKAQSDLEAKVAGLPRPLDRGEVTDIVKTEATKAVEAGKDPRFSILGLNVGPDTTGNVTFTGKGRFFAPFSGAHALQAEGEYLYYRDRQEGQFDVGLVNRYKNFQAGVFSSMKYANIREFDSGGMLGQAAVTLDYLFRRGRIGMFGTKGYRDNVVVNRRTISNNIFEESYLKIADQIGGSTQIGLHGDAYVEGNLGAIFRRGGSNRPGGTVRFVQPISNLWAFTVEAGLNETLVGNNDHGRVVFGIQLGNWVRPKEFVDLKHPVPVDIPRVRYEVLTRRVRTGNDAPVADAGADRTVNPGTVTLDGSGSFDPDGDPLTFEWTQIAGPAVAISGRNTQQASFTGADGQVYSFRLTVRDDHGGQGVDRVTITVRSDVVKINRFTATPTRITAGETVTLAWEILNADEAEISGLGRVDARSGTSTVAPTQTTTYRLTARNRQGSEVSESVTVVVDRPEPRILRFTATPMTINAGQSSTLAWETENADTVSISGIGNVSRSGTAPVSPTQTTTYTITARNQFAEVSSTVTVQVTPAQAPRIIRFAATPPEISPGEQSTLVWQVENATEVNITGLGRVDLSGTSAVSPAGDTTYTITARNATGEVSATAVVTVLQPVKILSFVAEPPSSARAGQPVTLRWTTENATEVVLTGVGRVDANGSATVMPQVDTSYSLVAYGRRSQATALVLVRVGPGAVQPPPPDGGGNGGEPGPNRPPVANAGPDQETTNFLVRLDGSRSFDPDGDPITYSWRQVGGPSAEIYAPTSVMPDVRLTGGFGTYTFELRVTDSKGASSTDTVAINLQFLHPPPPTP